MLQRPARRIAYPRCHWFIACTPQPFTYALDAMERPTGMTDNAPYTWVSGVTYTAGGQTSYGGRTYNSLLQVTHVGQITSSVDERRSPTSMTR